MTLRKALLIATVMALPAAAMAQPVDGLYVSGGLGGSWLLKSTATSKGLSGNLVAPKTGFAGQASVGYGYANGLRAELEVYGTANSVHGVFSGKTVFSGQEYNYGVMANGLYDIDVGLPVTPYVGVGAGYIFTQLDSTSLGSIAVQGIVGASYYLGSGLSVTLDNRLVDKLQNRTYSGVKLKTQLDDQLLIGLRYSFGAAPAAAAAAPAPVTAVAPAPAPARSYLVFFDWDSAALTARAQQIIADAAKNSTAVKATKIDVAGHADKSGTASYNQTLSLKRANNVAAELVRLGVPKTAISISAFGDTKPLVPTAAGVREPQNRRVEIVLH
jgi:outer membrane protein OmpA-like peptidoglycan-associated protein